jgi:hypothetical protein
MRIGREEARLRVVSTMPKGLESVSAELHIYILLCMFNGFAFARPLCRVIKRCV